MPTRSQQNHTVWTALLDDTSGTIARGRVLVLNADGDRYLPSTSANRTAVNRRSAGISLTAADGETVRAVEFQFVGIVDASISLLGAGEAWPLRVSTTGYLERVETPSVLDDVVGRCDEDGTAYVNFSTVAEVTAGGISPAGDPGDTQINLDDAQLTASQQGIAPEFFGVTAAGSAAANNAALLTTAAAFGGTRGDFALTVPTKTFSTEGFSRSLTPGTERWPYGLSVMGKGPTSVFQLAPDSVPDSNHLFLFEDTSSERERGTLLCHFRIAGTASGAFGAGGGSDQNGVEIGFLGVDGGSDFLLFGLSGYRLKGRLASVTSADGLSFGPRIIGNIVKDSLYAFYIAHPATLLANQVIACDTGIRVNGNVSDISSTYQGCNTAHRAIGGGNDAHDLSLGNRYVHNFVAFNIDALTNGKLISDCLVYEGYVNISAGGAVVSVNGGQWDATGYNLLGASVWRGVDFDDGYSGVIVMGASSQNEFMRDCRDMTGNVPAMIGEYIQAEFAFAANANETLTPQMSVAATLIVTDGAAAVARQITSTLLARRGNERRIINDGTFNHTFKFASGAAVTIPADSWMVVGTDASGDAYALESGGGASGSPGGSVTQMQFHGVGGVFAGTPGIIVDQTAGGGDFEDDEVEHHGKPRHREEWADFMDVNLETYGKARSQWLSGGTVGTASTQLGAVEIVAGWGDGVFSIAVETTASYQTSGGSIEAGNWTHKALFKRDGGTMTQIGATEDLSIVAFAPPDAMNGPSMAVVDNNTIGLSYEGLAGGDSAGEVYWVSSVHVHILRDAPALEPDP